MPKTVVPVILSGGSGQRLWPLSRELYPKQLISLVSEISLLQETAKRLNGGPFADPVIVCNDSHRFIVAEQLRAVDIRAQAIVLEPSRRNTAPAAAVAWPCSIGSAIQITTCADRVAGRVGPRIIAISTAVIE